MSFSEMDSQPDSYNVSYANRALALSYCILFTLHLV